MRPDTQPDLDALERDQNLTDLERDQKTGPSIQLTDTGRQQCSTNSMDNEQQVTI